MITKIYRVKGTFVMGDSYHKFTKEYKATNVADLEEKIYERFGSKHGLNRNQISIKFLLIFHSNALIKFLLKLGLQHLQVRFQQYL